MTIMIASWWIPVILTVVLGVIAFILSPGPGSGYLPDPTGVLLFLAWIIASLIVWLCWFAWLAWRGGAA